MQLVKNTLKTELPEAWQTRIAKILHLVAVPLVLWMFFTWFFGVRQGLLWLVGIGFGCALALPKFGFTTGWRVFILKRDAKGLQAQLILLALLSFLSYFVFLSNEHFQGAIAPINFGLIFGAFVFGACMQLADGCGSGTLYKAGVGNGYSLLILPFFIFGAFFGTLHVDFWHSIGSIAPEQDLKKNLGDQYLLVQLGILLGLFVVVSLLGRGVKSSNWKDAKIFWAAGLLALLALLNLALVGQPWGVVYGLGLWGAKFFSWFGFPVTDFAYWQQDYNRYALEHSLLLDNTSMTNLGLIYGAFCVGLQRPTAQNPANPAKKPHFQSILKIVAIGLILGYSSRLAYGCNIGALVGGISSGSLHAWVWFVCAFLGSGCLLKYRSFRGKA